MMADLQADDLQRMHDEILLRMELLDLLYDFAPQVQGPAELADALNFTATTVQALLQGEWCALLVNQDDGLELCGCAGEIPNACTDWLQAGRLPFPDSQMPTRAAFLETAGNQPLLLAPMAVRGVTMGWVVVGYLPGKQDVDPRDLELATGISRQAAIALENTWMVQQIRKEQAATAAANAALRQRESELQMLNARLAEATRLKSEFLAKMSHELRTPLNAIIGFSEALLAGVDGPISAEQRESLAFIQQGGVNLLQLINDLLDLSKIEAGRLTIEPEDLVVGDLLTHAVETLRPLAAAKGLRLNLRVDPSLPMLFTDPRRLRQIIINLVGNAIKFTERGGVEIVAMSSDDRVCELSVVDTGIGIPPERLTDIFDEFTQVEKTSTRKESGTGLGLAICRRLVELMGGTITADSAPGQGSTFRVRLPLRLGEARLLPSTTGAVAAVAATDRAGDLVVVIDDDPAVHRLVSKALQGTRFRVQGSISGNEGLQLVRQLHPAAVVLDLIMPEKDGWQVLGELRRDPATRAVPVVVLTVLEQPSVSEPVIGYLTKPLQPGQLRSLLERLPEGGE